MTVKELQNNIPVCGIDTVEVISDTEARADLSKLTFVHSASRFRLADGKIKYVINPDKANDCRTILSYDKYREVFRTMLDKMELTNPNISRIDFRFDRYGGEYAELVKLNTAVLLMLAQEYKVTNRYASTDLLTGESLTLRLQNKYIECEYYNKRQQSPNEGIESRLELRSKSLADGADEWHELDLWFDRLDKAISRSQYNDMQDTINAYLLMQYEAERRSNPKIKTIDFVNRNSGRIFTKSQLTNLLDRIGGYTNIDQAARRIINRYNLETVSYSLIKNYIEQLRQSADRFLIS